MSDELSNFRAWFADVLNLLYPHRDAGIAVFMISAPLLERYLREKNKLAPSVDLGGNDAALKDLCGMFPALHDVTAARHF